jgi:peptidyl-prolyl cis-trans isomerase B (cyclophilin B)
MSRSVSKINDRDSFNLIAEGGFTQGDRKIDVVFLETMIYDSKKQYTFAIATDDMTIIDVASQHLSDTAESLKILSQDTTSVTITQQPSTDEEGGGCLIATAAYGSEMAPQVQFLRELRDNTVLQTQVGTNFMTGFNQFYYSFSPAVADYERENPMFKEAVKLTLTPLLTSLAILNYVDIDTEQEMLGYGIGVILLNIGMYFVAPAAVIIAIKSRIKHRSKPFSI